MKNSNDEYDWGIVINFKKQHGGSGGRNPATSKGGVDIDVLLNLKQSQQDAPPSPLPVEENGEVEIVCVSHTTINQISSIRLYHPTDLKLRERRRAVLQTIRVSIRCQFFPFYIA